MKRQIRHIVTLAYLSVCNRDLARLYARVTGQAVRFLSLLPSKVIIIVIKFMFLSMNKYWALLVSF